jgi:hypothetical protein
VQLRLSEKRKEGRGNQKIIRNTLKAKTNVLFDLCRKLLKYKKEVMGRLLDIKSEGGMYSSHKRVLIKELLETLRKWNEELEH